MPSEASLRLTGGGDVVRLVEAEIAALLPTNEDFLYVVERQRARILDRTVRGVDYEERPFAAYSEKSPYTWYPHGHATKSPTQRTAAAKRMQRKLGAGQVTAGGGIRFESYAAFKRTGLGRANVDLTGPSAPHMMQGLVSRTTGPLEMRLGIYSADKAEIAEYHNTGTPRMPQRQFLGTSAADALAMEGDLVARIQARAGKSK